MIIVSVPADDPPCDAEAVLAVVAEQLRNTLALIEGSLK
jgi:hypothetical protein